MCYRSDVNIGYTERGQYPRLVLRWHGVPGDGNVTERAVEVPPEFMLKIGAVVEKVPYGALVSNDFLSRAP